MSLRFIFAALMTLTGGSAAPFLFFLHCLQMLGVALLFGFGHGVLNASARRPHADGSAGRPNRNSVGS
jgi:hypothetical protein